MFARIIMRITGWAVGVYYDVERRGPPLSPGPVLVTANHPNALVDPIVVFRTARRVVRPLAKAPLFEQALIGTVLRGLGGLPVYRRQDDPALMHLNESTFDAAIAALHAGEAVQIYPEGQSHSDPALAPLKTGAARLALLAEERSGWTLGLVIQPIGLTYVGKHRFRGKALATVGAPLPVAPYRPAFEADPREAARMLTERVRDALEAVTLNLEQPGDHDLIEVAERLYVRHKGWAGWRTPEPLARRFPRLQTFARGLAWVRANEPGTYAELERDVERYRRFARLFGAREADVPPRYTLGRSTWYLLRNLVVVALLAVPALVGWLAWALPYYGPPRLVTRIVRPKLDQVATYTLGVSLLSFPAMWLVWGALAWWWGGARWSVGIALASPVAGFASIALAERLGRARRDVTVFLRALRSGRGPARLDALRTELARRFDEVAARMPGDDDASDGAADDAAEAEAAAEADPPPGARGGTS